MPTQQAMAGLEQKVTQLTSLLTECEDKYQV
jgi:hypothetical protein